MFEQASRLKLRFAHRGLCTTEDLWDLPLTALDGIYQQLNRQLKTATEESLLDIRSKEDEVIDLQISIVKHIVAVRLAEQAEREQESSKAARKQKILGIIADKQDAQLQSLPLEELQKLVDEV